MIDADKHDEAELQAEPVPHEIEHRLLGNGGDPSAHLGQNDDSDRRESEYPD